MNYSEYLHKYSKIDPISKKKENYYDTTINTINKRPPDKRSDGQMFVSPNFNRKQLLILN